MTIYPANVKHACDLHLYVLIVYTTSREYLLMIRIFVRRFVRSGFVEKILFHFSYSPFVYLVTQIPYFTFASNRIEKADRVCSLNTHPHQGTRVHWFTCNIFTHHSARKYADTKQISHRQKIFERTNSNNLISSSYSLVSSTSTPKATSSKSQFDFLLTFHRLMSHCEIIFVLRCSEEDRREGGSVVKMHVQDYLYSSTILE